VVRISALRMVRKLNLFLSMGPAAVRPVCAGVDGLLGDVRLGVELLEVFEGLGGNWARLRGSV
jgi:hypothetical protein